MSEDVFGDRRQALEDSFFHKKDQELLAKLKEAAAGTENLRKALAAATGVDDSAFLDKLVDLGVQPEMALALSLVPLVQVAWADGKIQQGERKAILSAAQDAGIEETTPSYALLQSWLENAPGDELKITWRGYVQALIETLSGNERRNFRESVLKRAQTVAAVTGGVLGLGNKISASEQRVLDELASAFETS